MKKTSFLKEAIGTIKTTGTIRPSSRYLIQKTLKGVDFGNSKVILEFGPGEGCITREIIRLMQNDARLLSFEINDAFLEYCYGQFSADTRVQIINRSAFEFRQILKDLNIDKVDYVISSLPLSLFDKAEVSGLMSDVGDSLAPGGAFVQYQYTLESYGLMKRSFSKVKVDFTVRNLPPAFIYTCLP